MFKTIALIAVAMVASLATADFCEDSYDECKFRFGFSEKVQTFKLVNESGVPFTRRIRSKMFGRMVGALNSNGMAAEFLFMKAGYPITGYGSPPYHRYHFKPLSIPGTSGFGIGHESFSGNQLMFARFRCVRVHFSSYQLLSFNGTKRNFNDLPQDNKNCIVFKMNWF